MNDLTTPATPAAAPKAADKKPRAPRKPAAPVVKNFTVAERARELKLDPKVARRRMRANVAKTKPLPTPKAAATTSRKNSRYEYPRTAENLKMIDTIIKTPE